jgi:hypothetical protein
MSGQEFIDALRGVAKGQPGAQTSELILRRYCYPVLEEHPQATARDVFRALLRGAAEMHIPATIQRARDVLGAKILPPAPVQVAVPALTEAEEIEALEQEGLTWSEAGAAEITQGPAKGRPRRRRPDVEPVTEAE